MKRIAAVIIATAMLVSVLGGCAQAKKENYSNDMKIPYAVDLSPEDGADSVERTGDHKDSPYFKHPDFYNMKSTDSLTILTNFKTIQQTSEWSCGVSAVMMALDWYDRLDGFNEQNLADFRHKLTGDLAEYPGTTLKQAMDMFDSVGGFDYITTLDYSDVHSEVTLKTFRDWLAEGKPILICWNDWGGHWQVIIGYDTMGTESEQDDVIIVADSYDTTDHNQDGYGIYPAQRFYYNFTMYNSFTEEEGGNDMLFIVPSPKA